MTKPSKSYGTLTIYRPISSINQDGTMELRSSATSSLELVFNSTSLCRRLHVDVWKPRHLTAWGGFPVGFTNSARGQLCAILSLTAGENFDRVQWKHTFWAETNKQTKTNQQNPRIINLGFFWRVGMRYSFPCKKNKCCRLIVIPKCVSFLEQPWN